MHLLTPTVEEAVREMDAKAKLAQEKKRKSLKRQRKRDEHAAKNNNSNKRPRLGDEAAAKSKPRSPDFLVKAFRLGAKEWNTAVS